MSKHSVALSSMAYNSGLVEGQRAYVEFANGHDDQTRQASFTRDHIEQIAREEDYYFIQESYNTGVLHGAQTMATRLGHG